MKKYIMVAIICMILVVTGGLLFARPDSAQAEQQQRREKGYRSIQITAGSTLWTIAEEYVSEEYDSIEAYIQEIKQLNGFGSDTIYEGRYIVVPYYYTVTEEDVLLPE